MNANNSAPTLPPELYGYDSSLEIPDFLITDADRNTKDHEYRMRELEKAADDPVGLYHGYPEVQKQLLVNDLANRRIQQTSPFLYATLLAKHLIRGAIQETPLFEATHLVPDARYPLYVKMENMHDKTKSFKGRGAANFVLSHDSSDYSEGIAAATAGNHGLGCADIANYIGVPAYNTMPLDAAASKVKGSLDNGAVVTQVGRTFDEAKRYHYGRFLRENPNLLDVPAYNDWRVTIGQATMLLESLQTFPYFREQFLAGGGGGLAAANMAAAHEFNPDMRQNLVQAENNDALLLSLAAGRLVTREWVDPASDGTAVATPGDIPFSVLKREVNRGVVVSNREIRQAQFLLEQTFGADVEAAGAQAMAGAIKTVDTWTGPALVVVSGGNKKDVAAENRSLVAA